ncbi:hypothetical protein QYP02_30090 [Pseudomonas aeruginosa]|nr:hypothetical protein [Pseudomonas aeruginosa]
MDKLEIEYALAKQVPDMARGFTIATSYGELHVGAVDAPVVMKVVRDLPDRRVEGRQERRGALCLIPDQWIREGQRRLCLRQQR